MGNQNGGPASAKNQQWAYDAAGNWTSTTKTIGNNAATHDAKGNLTAYEINGKEYEVDYDLDNRIIKADIDGDDVEYRYDAFGRRVIRKEGSTKTALIWWANSECAEYKHSSGQAAIQNDLFAHPSRLNAVIARAVDGSKSKLQWYHKNYLDHVYAVSDDDGDILEHYRYTAFGEVTIYNATGVQQTTTQINNQILWNTRRRDTVSGYYMYKFRHYSAELGRWPSRDPIEEDGGVNLYAFVENDGINEWDELGLASKLAMVYCKCVDKCLLKLKVNFNLANGQIEKCEGTAESVGTESGFEYIEENDKDWQITSRIRIKANIAAARKLVEDRFAGVRACGCECVKKTEANKCKCVKIFFWSGNFEEFLEYTPPSLPEPPRDYYFEFKPGSNTNNWDSHLRDLEEAELLRDEVFGGG